MNKLISILTSIGQLIILSFLWFLTCIPIITLTTSTAALYYAVVKSVRRETGYPVKEYFKMFKRSFIKGSIITLLFAGIIGLSLLGREYINAGNTAFMLTFDGAQILYYLVYDGLIVIALVVGMYVPAVLSRFEMKAMDIIKLSFVMALRHLHYTIALIAIFAVIICLQFFILPVWTVLLLPAPITLAASLVVEKAMKRYIPVTDDNQDEWYMF